MLSHFEPLYAPRRYKGKDTSGQVALGRPPKVRSLVAGKLYKYQLSKKEGMKPSTSSLFHFIHRHLYSTSFYIPTSHYSTEFPSSDFLFKNISILLAPIQHSLYSPSGIRSSLSDRGVATGGDVFLYFRFDFLPVLSNFFGSFSELLCDAIESEVTTTIESAVADESDTSSLEVFTIPRELGRNTNPAPAQRIVMSPKAINPLRSLGEKPFILFCVLYSYIFLHKQENLYRKIAPVIGFF